MRSEHGFHNTELINEHFLCLVISELMEAVEADRKNRRFDKEKHKLGEYAEYQGWLTTEEKFINVFNRYIKDTVEDELSDAVIRLLDLAGSLDISLDDIYDFTNEPEYKDWNYVLKEMSFTERMFFLTSILTEDRDIAEVIKASIVIIFLNADLLNIDLLWHIVQKQRYNELRENKHGKRY